MSETIVEKIIRVLNINLPKETRSEIWQWCYSHVSQVPITEDNLENMSKTELVWGIYGGYPGNQGTEILNSIAIIKLAQGLGILGSQNPEGGVNPYPLVNVKKQTDSQLLAQIEKSIGFKLNLPLFLGGNNLSQTDYGVISDRHCAYLWILKRINDLFPFRSDRRIRVIEIGAGIGLLGYFLNKIRNLVDYTIIDLAYTNSLQTYFLHKNLPDTKLILSGDVEDPFDEKYHTAIKILHASDFDMVPSGKFDIMINIDSLTEMDIQDAYRYANSDCAKLLLSINHEMNNFRVVDICKATRELKYRYPFWVRDGYVEELYQSIFIK